MQAGLPRRLRLLVANPALAISRARVRSVMARYRWVNRIGRRPITGDARAVVSLTTFGHRVDTVFYTIETIAAGTVRPQRLILWLDEEAVLASPPQSIRRLQRRGLEVLPCADYGPHKKQYPFAATTDSLGLPLVTADDDVFYPRGWLAGLLAAHDEHPDVINGYRAHRVMLRNGAIAPYAEWVPATDSEESFRTFCTGVSGIIYPPEFLSKLRAEGERFLQVAPHADDVWVHAVAVQHGVRSRQVGDRQAQFTAVPGTQLGTLQRRNVREGGNDVQIAACYGPIALRRLRESQRDDR